MNKKFGLKHLHKKMPVYMLIILLLISTIMHTYFLIKHPGSNFVEPTEEQIQEQLENEEITESVAKLREHTWKYGSRDAYLYTNMANQLIEHGVYGYDTRNTGEIIKNAFVTPGHPLLLVAIFHVADLFQVEQMTMVKLFNMVLSIGTVLLLYLIASQIFKNRWVGVVAAGLYTFYLTPLHYFRTALTETPGIFFFCLAIYVFLLALHTNKKILHMLFAIIFCYGVMIRPVIAPLVLIGFAVTAFRHRHQYKQFFSVTIFWGIGASVVILPWLIRNYIAFGDFILFSTHSGNSWFAGSNPFNMYDFSEYWKERYELGMEAKDYAIMKIKEGFQENFGLWLSWFTIGKTYELFKIPDAIYYYTALSYMDVFKWTHHIIVNGALITSVVAVLTRKKKLLALASVAFMYIGLSNLFLTIPRYGFFIIPVLCIITAAGIVVLLSTCSRFVIKRYDQMKNASKA
ncbi:dolichyl-phosphate-mannose-protein mannosyltransferase [Oceanobacillus picturae]|uniref:Dolichyl-phosphate-mannose-protein mannosyltransferase n=2 Tax=Oceanobacillus picturae TaxID=171693 RepID=A0A0U9H2L2_9BACI|nr:dolichyl-phosphate-mannose-protein mannosyltransferase [Oceanobacillus picturae]